KNTWYPGVISGVALIAHVAVAPGLMQTYGLQGLNYSTLLSSSLNFILLLASFQLVVTHFAWSRFFLQILRFIPAALVMAVILFKQNLWTDILGPLPGGKILSLVISMLLSGAAYLLVSWMMGLEESHATVERLGGKIKRKLMRKK